MQRRYSLANRVRWPEMSTESTLSQALRISTEQLLLLRNEDVEGYSAGLAAQEAACAAMSKLDVAGLSDIERGQLERLVQTNSEILENVNRWIGRQKVQMAKMRDARNTVRAYGATPPPGPMRTISA
jgi:hypothetical protein